MHQSIPAAPSTPSPRAHPRELVCFFALDGKFPGWGLSSCQILRGGDEKRGQMPCPPSTLQHFSLIAQSSRAILSILMCDFLFQLKLINYRLHAVSWRRDETSLWFQYERMVFK